MVKICCTRVEFSKISKHTYLLAQYPEIVMVKLIPLLSIKGLAQLKKEYEMRWFIN